MWELWGSREQPWEGHEQQGRAIPSSPVLQRKRKDTPPAVLWVLGTHPPVPAFPNATEMSSPSNTFISPLPPILPYRSTSQFSSLRAWIPYACAFTPLWFPAHKSQAQVLTFHSKTLPTIFRQYHMSPRASWSINIFAFVSTSHNRYSKDLTSLGNMHMSIKVISVITHI